MTEDADVTSQSSTLASTRALELKHSSVAASGTAKGLTSLNFSSKRIEFQRRARADLLSKPFFSSPILIVVLAPRYPKPSRIR